MTFEQCTTISQQGFSCNEIESPFNRLLTQLRHKTNLIGVFLKTDFNEKYVILNHMVINHFYSSRSA